jgi:hypothetical protein
MPGRKNPIPVSIQSSIQQSLSQAAQEFAQQILGILGASTLTELSALSGRRVEPGAATRPGPNGAQATAPIGNGLALKKNPTPRTSALRRQAGTKPVQCPVEGCTSPGVRSKMNFCHDHFIQLSNAQKLELRNAQRAAHLQEIKAKKAAALGISDTASISVDQVAIDRKPAKRPVGRPPGSRAAAPKVVKKKQSGRKPGPKPKTQKNKTRR